MIPIGIIVFREFLEIVLILSIIMNATKNIYKRNFYVISGFILGAVGAAILAYFTIEIDQAFSGIGQEIVNAIALLFTSIMIGFTVIWMNKNARKTGSDIKKTVDDIEYGKKKLSYLIYLVGLLVLREGSEIVIYVGSIVSVKSIPLSEVSIAVISGILLASVVGIGFYYGYNTMLNKYLFPVSNIIMIIIAAGLSAQAANFLIAADLIPEIISSLWNVTDYLSEGTNIFISNFVGNILNPSLMEILFFIITLGVILIFLKYSQPQKMASH